MKMDDEIFRENINFGYKISQDYKNYRRIYLELNIAFVSFFSLAINFYIAFFVGTTWAYGLIMFGFIVLLLSTSIDIVYNLLEHKTSPTEPTWIHYRGHKQNLGDYNTFKRYFHGKSIDDINLKQLYNTFKYQENYDRLLRWTRRLTLFSILSFLLCNFIGIILLLFKL